MEGDGSGWGSGEIVVVSLFSLGGGEGGIG